MNKEKGKHLETHLHRTISHDCPKWAATPASRSTQCQFPVCMDSTSLAGVSGSAGDVILGRRLSFACLVVS